MGVDDGGIPLALPMDGWNAYAPHHKRSALSFRGQACGRRLDRVEAEGEGPAEGGEAEGKTVSAYYHFDSRLVYY